MSKKPYFGGWIPEKRPSKIIYGIVLNGYLWVSLHRTHSPASDKGICLQQFERALGRPLVAGERIRFRLEEVK
jgi:hypothetical protein